MRTSISHATRDLEILGRLAIVPGLAGATTAIGVVVFLVLALIDPRPMAPWFVTAIYTGILVAVSLGWVAIGIRGASTLPVTIAVLAFSLGVLLLVVWWSRAGQPAIVVVLTAATIVAVALGWIATRVIKGSTQAIGLLSLFFSLAVALLVGVLSRFEDDLGFVAGLTCVMPLLAASSWWGLPITRRLHARFPARFSRPHATRRLSLPRDARALRALLSVLGGGLQLLMLLLVALALAPLLRQGALVVSRKWFMPAALKHFRRARAILALRAQEVRVDDRRPPVLLLRSFADDDLAMQRTKAFLIGVTSTGLSLEEQMVAQLWEVGPVVTIGQPGQNVGPIGAAREQIVGPLWQPRVIALLDESTLAVVVLGQTEGLFWECEQLAQRRVPVLIIWPPTATDGLVSRWQRFTAAYPPAQGIRVEGDAELPLLVWFPADHEPLVVSGHTRDERSYELAFALWHHNSIMSGHTQA